MFVRNPYFKICTKDANHPYHEKKCDENCPDALKCGLGEFVDPKLLSKSKLEEILYELSELEFKAFLEDFVEDHFSDYDVAELPKKDELGFLVCNRKLLIVFKYEDGVWKFDRLEKTAYAGQY